MTNRTPARDRLGAMGYGIAGAVIIVALVVVVATY